MTGTSFEMPLGPFMAAMTKATTMVADTQHLAEQIGAALVSGTQDRFDAGKAPDGSDWAPTKRGGQILVDTGALKDSVGYEASPGLVVVGTADVRAGTHQFGAKKGAYGSTGKGHPIPWGDIPARRFLGIGPDDEEESLQTASQTLQRVLAGRG